jgi:hypothetical protein
VNGLDSPLGIVLLQDDATGFLDVTTWTDVKQSGSPRRCLLAGRHYRRFRSIRFDLDRFPLSVGDGLESRSVGGVDRFHLADRDTLMQRITEEDP